jgi:hypothetical protein
VLERDAEQISLITGWSIGHRPRPPAYPLLIQAAFGIQHTDSS